jgi:mannosyltransferase OCH1-like enzyme
LHYIWPNTNFSFGEKDPNGIEQRRTLENIQSIRESNPQWTVRVWTDDDCDALVKEHFSDFYPHWTSLTPRLKLWDAVRPVILHVHGGIYLDHDVVCNEGVSFDDWILPETTLLLRQAHNRRQGNHFMGSVPHHALWKLYINNIIQQIPLNYTVGKHTGPRQLYPTFQQYHLSISKEEYSQIRLLGLHEFDSTGECEHASIHGYAGYCLQPRCTHQHSISPAELDGQDDNPEKQMKEFQERLNEKNE